MATRFDSLVIDTPDPAGLSRWWARALAWAGPDPDDGGDADDLGDPDDLVVRPAAGRPGLDLVFVRVDDPKLEKNRVHLDLTSASLQDQRDIVERLVRLGAHRAEIGQGDVPWTVLTDPEGNEFCVLEPRERYRGAGTVAAVVVDAEDPPSLARFWAAATGWRLTDSGPAGAALHPTVEPGRTTGAIGPYLEFVPVPQPHRVKNRQHLDVRPDPGGDQQAEVARLIRLGARRIEIGQSAAPPGQVHWVVMADPEGNEFCVLRPPAPS